MSTHEQLARARKVTRLVAQIDNLACDAGLSPLTQASELASLLERWTPARWSELAVCAGCHPPSAATVAAVVAVYRDRSQLRAS
jgi:hypothetical protein